MEKKEKNRKKTERQIWGTWKEKGGGGRGGQSDVMQR